MTGGAGIDKRDNGIARASSETEKAGILQRLIVLSVTFICLYIACFFIIFDIKEAASSWDEDNYGVRQVAIGPRPRSVFVSPSHWATAYEPDQWPFRCYRPLCEVWLKVHDFAPPVEWR